MFAVLARIFSYYVKFEKHQNIIDNNHRTPQQLAPARHTKCRATAQPSIIGSAVARHRRLKYVCVHLFLFDDNANALEPFI